MSEVSNVFSDNKLLCFYLLHIEAPFYEGTEFRCLSNGHTIPLDHVNDDYCDCDDGSDEPGMSRVCMWGHLQCGKNCVCGEVGDSKLVTVHNTDSYISLPEIVLFLIRKWSTYRAGESAKRLTRLLEVKLWNDFLGLVYILALPHDIALI